MKKTAFLMVLLVTAGLLLWPWQARAQNGDMHYFPETGHTVQNAFWTFYQSTPDALLIFGYPITDAFLDSQGRQVQYFQRARFEQGVSTSSQVTLTPLGTLVRAGQKELQPANIPISKTACRAFANGQLLCYDFLTFWEQHNGERYLGMPIAPIEKEGERFVQYLEYARLEWHPEALPGQQIVVAPLGEIYFNMAAENPRLLQSTGSAFIGVDAPLDINVHAFVTRTSVSQHDEQQIYIIVRDQNHQPVQGAVASASLVYADGSFASFIAEHATNSHGFTVITAIVNTTQFGLVKVNVEVTSPQGVIEKTSTSFRIWY
ncbi:MAG: hypothetical protein Fur0018_04650 [Anaerolineales bacterium]